ncbi:hypothetical protein DFH08DRAFT_819843 [Mycena albidolilacea]|uniref:Uncharacterized protein n=1 Tax=Mycena albidolilacea TaxID=1033008 RepID=A0AAD7EEN9_9AGAR|nr:hypothetical protein DFH08DRAFT_819843 [Mycena albidolilacea]
MLYTPPFEWSGGSDDFWTCERRDRLESGIHTLCVVRDAGRGFGWIDLQVVEDFLRFQGHETRTRQEEFDWSLERQSISVADTSREWGGSSREHGGQGTKQILLAFALASVVAAQASLIGLASHAWACTHLPSFPSPRQSAPKPYATGDSVGVVIYVTRISKSMVAAAIGSSLAVSFLVGIGTPFCFVHPARKQIRWASAPEVPLATTRTSPGGAISWRAKREAQRLTGPWKIGAEAVMYTHEKDVVATRILEDEEKDEDVPTYAD